MNSEYKIIEGYTLTELENRVQELMNDRTIPTMKWVPTGGITLDGKYYYQAMVYKGIE